MTGHYCNADAVVKPLSIAVMAIALNCHNANTVNTGAGNGVSIMVLAMVLGLWCWQQWLHYGVSNKKHVTVKATVPVMVST